MPRAKVPAPETTPSCSWFYSPQCERHWVKASYQPSGEVYLYVPRDGRYWVWHKSYWNGVPEWAREKDYVTGLHWVAELYAESAVSVLQAFYPELRIERL